MALPTNLTSILIDFGSSWKKNWERKTQIFLKITHRIFPDCQYLYVIAAVMSSAHCTSDSFIHYLLCFKINLHCNSEMCAFLKAELLATYDHSSTKKPPTLIIIKDGITLMTNILNGEHFFFHSHEPEYCSYSTLSAKDFREICAYRITLLWVVFILWSQDLIF